VAGEKIEKRIANWSHRWLSLGGRVTLVKVVLESIPVYWLSLAKIPKSILNTIRKRMFSFLWTGKKTKEGIHLTRWNTIAKPKKLGGWGIKNIFTFGKALAAKSLWRCLMVHGLWHEVILKKYLRKKSVVAWFREGGKNWNGISNIWRALTSSLSIITDWLIWKPGNGREIRIGVDPMIGSHTYYKLSRNLILALKAQGIEFLAQAGFQGAASTRLPRWKKARDLGLEGDLIDEWNNYVKGLVGSGFELNNEKDVLLWSWDTKGDQVTTKQAYEAQLEEAVLVEPVFWYSELWNWLLPLKIKLFMWLLFEQKILTWENLYKRGILGPSRCVLCGTQEENLKHLFVDCIFTKNIWATILLELKIDSVWEGEQVDVCCENWIKKKENCKEVPGFICWEVWKHKNLAIFEDHPINRVTVCNRILQDLGEVTGSKCTKVSRIERSPFLVGDWPVGFFDGASQERGTKCGAGAVIKCPVLGTFRIKMNCGSGTNTRGELLALWCLLYFASHKKISKLNLVGDSKVIIDWFSNKNDLQVVSLLPWMARIRVLSRNFSQLRAKHIYRAYNQEVDQLSKEALLLDEDGIYFVGGAEGDSTIFERMEII
jgi:ribonuclease HI